MKSFWAYMKLQILLLRARTLPRIMLLSVLLAAVLPALIAGDSSRGSSSLGGAAPAAEGFGILADTANLVVTTIIILTTIMAAVSLSGDAASGALRAVLVRPLSRSAMISGQVLHLAAVTTVLYLFGMLTAWLLVSQVIGFSPVELEGYVILDVDRMLGYAWQLLLLPLPAVICAPLVALFVSSFVEDLALAVVLSLALVMGPFLFGALVDDRLPMWIFTEQARHPVKVLADLSRGIETEVRPLESGQIAYDALRVPFAYATLVWGGALLVFNARDVKV